MISKEHFKIPFSITVTCYIGKQLIGNHSAEGFFFLLLHNKYKVQLRGEHPKMLAKIIVHFDWFLVVIY